MRVNLRARIDRLRNWQVKLLNFKKKLKLEMQISEKHSHHPIMEKFHQLKAPADILIQEALFHLLRFQTNHLQHNMEITQLEEVETQPIIPAQVEFQAVVQVMENKIKLVDFQVVEQVMVKVEPKVIWQLDMVHQELQTSPMVKQEAANQLEVLEI